METVLVTGGAGFIGSHTCVELLQAGYKVIVIDNFANSEPTALRAVKKITNLEVDSYTGDFQDKALLDKVFTDHAIGSVIHFAAYKSVSQSIEQPLDYYQNNVAGLLSLLEAMSSHKVTRLVFSSSATVYGEADEVPTPESSPFQPAASPYGSTKQMCETIIKDFSASNKSFQAVSLRYFNPIGAHPTGLIGELPIGTPSNLIPFVTQAVAGVRDQLTVFGNDYDTPDGSCVRDYIHVVDLAKAHLTALDYLQECKSGYYDVFNVGTGQGSSVLEVIKTFEAVTKLKVPYSIGARRPGDVVISCAAVSKIKHQLGWQASLGLSDALLDAWNWQQQIDRSAK